MNTPRHASRRAAAQRVRRWWDNHQRLWDEWAGAQRDRTISPCICARCRSNPQHQHGEIARLDARLARIEAEIAVSAAEGARLFKHPRTRGCFDAPMIPTTLVLLWAPQKAPVASSRWQGAYSRRAHVRDMKQCYGPDWWRRVDGD